LDHAAGAQGIHDEAHHDDHAVHEPHESPWLMTVPLIVLAILSTIGGFIGVPYALGSLVGLHPTNYIEQTLDPVIAKVPVGKTEGAPAAEPVGYHSRRNRRMAHQRLFLWTNPQKAHIPRKKSALNAYWRWCLSL